MSEKELNPFAHSAETHAADDARKDHITILERLDTVHESLEYQAAVFREALLFILRQMETT